VGGDFRVLRCFDLTSSLFTSMVQDCQALFCFLFRRPKNVHSHNWAKPAFRVRRIQVAKFLPTAIRRTSINNKDRSPACIPG
jgi:hypothetical protein